MPREKKHMSIAGLKGNDLNMLHKMKNLAESFLVEKCHNLQDFRIGFHSVPSMDQLHLHLISCDFISECLKTKKHWISFTTDFFRPLDTVISSLEEQGAVIVDSAAEEAKLKGKLQCHRCSLILRDIPKLKSHIVTHQQKV